MRFSFDAKFSGFPGLGKLSGLFGLIVNYISIKYVSSTTTMRSE